MNRREFAGALPAGAAATLVAAAPAQRAGTPAKNIMMLHGLYADGSCWSRVVDGGHLSLVSHVQEVLGLILRAAAAS
jgi:hypothetical protein